MDHQGEHLLMRDHQDPFLEWHPEQVHSLQHFCSELILQNKCDLDSTGIIVTLIQIKLQATNRN
jgi:hypothetical protein